MEAPDITTLIARCAPSNLTRPVAAIMRQASASELLLVTIAGKRPIRVLADSKPEAIALASEAVVAGQTVRIGMAQLDPEDLKSAGLTIATAFDPCAHIAGVGRVFQERRARLIAEGVPETIAGDQAVSSFKSARTTGYPEGAFASGFARDLDVGYREALQGTRLFRNELYLTIVAHPGRDRAEAAAGFVSRLGQARSPRAISRPCRRFIAIRRASLQAIIGDRPSRC